MYTIIEDCSPYYIRFTHPNIDKIIDICQQNVKGLNFNRPFTHYRYPADVRNQILQATPLIQQLQLNLNRASLFVTQPGVYYRAHKDGPNHRISLNYTVEILDDKCVTSWYNDKDLKDYPIDTKHGWSREASGFDKSLHTPIKTMIAKSRECVLFNTEIFHDFDNSQSSNRRSVLTLRMANPGSFYFDDAKKALFGI